MADYNVTYTATGSFAQLIADALKAKKVLEDLDGTTKDLGESTQENTKASEKNARALRQEESASTKLDRSRARQISTLKEEERVLERAHKNRKALNDLASGSSGSRERDAKRAYERALYHAAAIRKQRDETGKLTAAQAKQLSVLDGLAKNFRAQQLGYKNLSDKQREVAQQEVERVAAHNQAIRQWLAAEKKFNSDKERAQKQAADKEAADSDYIDKLKRTHYRNQLQDFQQTTARMDGIFSKSLQDQLKIRLAAAKKQEAVDKKSTEANAKSTDNVLRNSLNRQFQERMTVLRKQWAEETRLVNAAKKQRDKDMLAGVSGGGGGGGKDRSVFAAMPGGRGGRNNNKDTQRDLASISGLLDHIGDGFGKAFKSFYAVKATAMGTAVIGIVSSLGALNSALFALGGAGVVAVQALA